MRAAWCKNWRRAASRCPRAAGHGRCRRHRFVDGPWSTRPTKTPACRSAWARPSQAQRGGAHDANYCCWGMNAPWRAGSCAGRNRHGLRLPGGRAELAWPARCTRWSACAACTKRRVNILRPFRLANVHLLFGDGMAMLCQRCSVRGHHRGGAATAVPWRGATSWPWGRLVAPMALSGEPADVAGDRQNPCTDWKLVPRPAFSP